MEGDGDGVYRWRGREMVRVSTEMGTGGGALVDQHVVDKIAELEGLFAMLKGRVAELELQLQVSLATTHNGLFLWRIPNVTQRRSDAKAKRISSIYSPPFYTSRFGYKLDWP